MRPPPQPRHLRRALPQRLVLRRQPPPVLPSPVSRLRFMTPRTRRIPSSPMCAWGRTTGMTGSWWSFGPPFPGAPAGVPEYIIRAAEPPLTQDPSAQPMDVPGSHHLLLALLGATKYDQDFTLRYTGPTRFDPGFPTLVAAYERGDFEATSSWYLGLDQEPCFRVFTLTDPMRLVVDVAH
ncbi:MAG: AMIN-like domain-containing (lipo)protein [Candidatus Limnocylindria bacterium]